MNIEGAKRNPYFAAGYACGVKARREDKSRIPNTRLMSASEAAGYVAGWDDEDRSLRTGEEHVQEVS